MIYKIKKLFLFICFLEIDRRYKEFKIFDIIVVEILGKDGY